MLKIRSIILFFFFVLILSFCTVNLKKSPRRAIKSHLVLEIQITNGGVEKACFSHLDSTVYILTKNYKILIYHNSEYISELGGKGLGKYNFSNLSDITLSLEGELLTLDAFDRNIRKFDKNGKYISEISLKSMDTPSKFDMTNTGGICLFDKGLRQFKIINTVLMDGTFEFGKLISGNVDFLRYNSDYISAYDSIKNITYHFNAMGFLIEKIEERVEFDRFGNKFILNHNVIKCEDKLIYASVNDVKYYTVANGFLIVCEDDFIKILRVVYEFY